jgi:hypothetical protein
MLTLNEYKAITNMVSDLMIVLHRTDAEFDKFCNDSKCCDCPLFETSCNTQDYLEYLESER